MKKTESKGKITCKQCGRVGRFYTNPCGICNSRKRQREEYKSYRLKSK